MSTGKARHAAGMLWPISLAAAVAVSWGSVTVLAGPGDSHDVSGAAPITLEQGWDKEERNLYYYTPQGSRMMPYSWFMALEHADTEERFASPRSMERYGWVASLDSTASNPGNLPVGFTLDEGDIPGAGPSVGMSCAACHTNDITYRGQTLRIDGAPTLANFPLFIAELAQALETTALREEKFQRFARAVYAPRTPSAEEVNALRSLFKAFTAKFSGQATLFAAMPSGPGRLDALTQIINSMSVTDLGVASNMRLPTAPVSYPHLWLTPKLDFVQWNPVASNPLARNIGEVLGVFGHARLTGPAEQRLTSTVRAEELHALESWLAGLKPPVWPENVLGPIDRPLAEKGQKLFQQDCRSCHNMPPFDLTRKEDNIVGKQFIRITGIPYGEVKTDKSYSEALLGRVINTGELGPLFNGEPVVPSSDFFLKTVGAVVERKLWDMKLSREEQLKYSDYRFYPGEKPQPWKPQRLDTLKAGPLLGMWATGPFLHNGSVPNIYELLSPAKERSRVFWVGSRELDTRKLGFKSTEEDLTEAERSALYRFDTTQSGNSNSGHEYPVGKIYTHEERMAVIEFLKSATLPQE